MRVVNVVTHRLSVMSLKLSNAAGEWSKDILIRNCKVTEGAGSIFILRSEGSNAQVSGVKVVENTIRDHGRFATNDKAAVNIGESTGSQGPDYWTACEVRNNTIQTPYPSGQGIWANDDTEARMREGIIIAENEIDLRDVNGNPQMYRGVSGGSQFGIFCRWKDAKITNNRVLGASGCGIDFGGKFTTGFRITGNTLKDCGGALTGDVQEGILYTATSSKDGIITDNIIEGGGGIESWPAISLRNTSSIQNIYIYGNTMTDTRPVNDFDAAADLSNSIFIITGHGFRQNDIVRYTNEGNSDIGGLTNETRYFVIRIDDDQFQLATEVDGTPLVLTAGTGTHRPKR